MVMTNVRLLLLSRFQRKKNKTSIAPLSRAVGIRCSKSDQ